MLTYQSQHGNGGSPAVYQDLLIVNCDGGDEAFVVALDKATGRVRWQTPRRQPFDQSYTTPLVINVNGADQLVSIGAYRAAAYEPRTGHEIWRVSYGSGFSNVPRPVFGHGLVYIATGFQQPTLHRGSRRRHRRRHALARRLDDDETGAVHAVTDLLVGDELYVVSDIGDGHVPRREDRRPSDWMQRLGGNYSASPILADGRLYFLSEEGIATVTGARTRVPTSSPATRSTGRRSPRLRCRTDPFSSAATRISIASGLALSHSHRSVHGTPATDLHLRAANRCRRGAKNYRRWSLRLGLAASSRTWGFGACPVTWRVSALSRHETP